MAKGKEPYLEQGPDHMQEEDSALEEIERQQQLDDIAEIVSRPSGRRFFRRLMSRGRVFGTTYTGNAHGHFLEGQRNIALIFLNDVFEAAPKWAAEILQPEENNEEGDENA